MKDDILDSSPEPGRESGMESGRNDPHALYVIKPAMVNAVWESEDPNKAATDCLLDYFER